MMTMNVHLFWKAFILVQCTIFCKSSGLLLEEEEKEVETIIVPKAKPMNTDNTHQLHYWLRKRKTTNIDINKREIPFHTPTNDLFDHSKTFTSTTRKTKQKENNAFDDIQARCKVKETFYLWFRPENSFQVDSLSLSQNGEIVNMSSKRCYNAGSVRSYSMEYFDDWQNYGGRFLSITGDVQSTKDGIQKIVSYEKTERENDNDFDCLLNLNYCKGLEDTYAKDTIQIYKYVDDEWENIPFTYSLDNNDEEFNTYQTIALSGDGNVMALAKKQENNSEDSKRNANNVIIQILKQEQEEGAAWTSMGTNSNFPSYSQKAALNEDGTIFIYERNEKYLTVLAYNESNATWNQVGEDLGYFGGYDFFFDTSLNGKIIAVSYQSVVEGVVDVYQWKDEDDETTTENNTNTTYYKQLGSQINTKNDLNGGKFQTLALSPDGKYVAVAFAGQGKVFHYVNDNDNESDLANDWEQLGSDIQVEEEGNGSDRYFVDISGSMMEDNNLKNIRVIFSAQSFAARVLEYKQNESEGEGESDWCRVGCDITRYSGLPLYIPIVTAFVYTLLVGGVIAAAGFLLAVAVVLAFIALITSPIWIPILIFLLILLSPILIVIAVVAAVIGIPLLAVLIMIGVLSALMFFFEVSFTEAFCSAIPSNDSSSSSDCFDSLLFTDELQDKLCEISNFCPWEKKVDYGISF